MGGKGRAGGESRPEERRQDTRRAREIVIHAEGDKTQDAMLEAIRTSGAPDAEKATGVRQVAPGKYVLNMATLDARNNLMRSTSWTERLGGKVDVQKDRFWVVAHGVKVHRRGEMDWARTSEEIVGQNGGIHPGLHIGSIGWKTIRGIELKRYSTIRFEVATPEQANDIISKGLVVNGEYRMCERHDPGLQFTHCWNCGGFGHIAAHCKKVVPCEKCGAAHRTVACTETRSPICRHCKKVGHMATSNDCPTVKARARKARATRDALPALYHTGQTSREPTVLHRRQTPGETENSETAVQLQREASVDQLEGWTTQTANGGKKRKIQRGSLPPITSPDNQQARGRGRPPIFPKSRQNGIGPIHAFLKTSQGYSTAKTTVTMRQTAIRDPEDVVMTETTITAKPRLPATEPGTIADSSILNPASYWAEGDSSQESTS